MPTWRLRPSGRFQGSTRARGCHESHQGVSNRQRLRSRSPPDATPQAVWTASRRPQDPAWPDLGLPEDMDRLPEREPDQSTAHQPHRPGHPQWEQEQEVDKEGQSLAKDLDDRSTPTHQCHQGRLRELQGLLPKDSTIGSSHRRLRPSRPHSARPLP